MNTFRTTVAAAALMLAGALPGAAQQFTLERDFDLLRRTDGRPLQNIYWVSLPLQPAIADLANTDAPASNKCVFDGGGTGVPDGLINVDDLICAWWTARDSPGQAGTFVVSYYDRDHCVMFYRFGTVGFSIRFGGTAFALQPDIGYQVLVTVPYGASYSPRNHAVLAGDHFEAWAGRPIVAAPTCPEGDPNCCAASATRNDLVSHPYHALYNSADEILCGLEGVDWTDADRDGRPDTCWQDANSNGVFDAGEQTTGVFDGRHAMTVSTFVNTEAVNAPLARLVTVALGRVRFTGTDFPLAAGEAYMLTLSRLHEPTIYLPPHS